MNWSQDIQLLQNNKHWVFIGKSKKFYEIWDYFIKIYLTKPKHISKRKKKQIFAFLFCFLSTVKKILETNAREKMGGLVQ